MSVGSFHASRTPTPVSRPHLTLVCLLRSFLVSSLSVPPSSFRSSHTVAFPSSLKVLPSHPVVTVSEDRTCPGPSTSTQIVDPPVTIETVLVPGTSPPSSSVTVASSPLVRTPSRPSHYRRGADEKMGVTVVRDPREVLQTSPYSPPSLPSGPSQTSQIHTSSSSVTSPLLPYYLSLTRPSFPLLPHPVQLSPFLPIFYRTWSL